MTRKTLSLMALGMLLLLVSAVVSTVPVTAQGIPTATPRPLFALPDASVPVYRGTVISLINNQRFAVTANTFSGTASVVDLVNKTIVAEVPVGADPRALAVAPDQSWMAVTSRSAGTVSLINLEVYEVTRTIPVGLWPWGVVTNGQRLYVALQGADVVAEVDVSTGQVLRRMAVPDSPAGLALWGEFLYVTHFHTGALSLLYLPTGQIVAEMAGTPDSALTQAVWVDPTEGRAYLPATRLNASEPALTFDNTVFPVVNVFDLRAVQTERARRLALDVADRPVNMPFDVSYDRLRRWLWVVNAGSNDVTVIDLATGFARGHVTVGANPRGITRYADGTFAFVYNALDGTISVIEMAFMEQVDKLAATRLDLPIDLLLGAQFFHGSADERLSEDRRLSCATCHFDGLPDGRTWLDFPGGARNTPALLDVRQTGPWGSAGQYDELADFNEYYLTIQHGDGLMDGPMYEPLGPANSGRAPDLDALVAYLNTLAGPGPNPLDIAPEAVEVGRAVFEAQGCTECHVPPLYLDGLQHDLGAGLVDTPSLRWLWASAPYLRDGSAAELFDVFAGMEGPHALLGRIPLEALDSLLDYLNALPLE